MSNPRAFALWDDANIHPIFDRTNKIKGMMTLRHGDWESLVTNNVDFFLSLWEFNMSFKITSIIGFLVGLVSLFTLGIPYMTGVNNTTTIEYSLMTFCRGFWSMVLWSVARWLSDTVEALSYLK